MYVRIHVYVIMYVNDAVHVLSPTTVVVTRGAHQIDRSTENHIFHWIDEVGEEVVVEVPNVDLR